MSSSGDPTHLTVGFTIALEVVPEDPDNVDLASVHAIGRDTADALRQIGCTIELIYTGQRGGFLVNVLIPALTTLWSQKEIILADGSALVTLLTPVALLVKHLQNAQEKHVGKNTAQQLPIKITVEIDGVSILIESPNLETADAIMKLAESFQKEHPTVAKKVTKQSNIKVKASVPRRPPQRRHK